MSPICSLSPGYLQTGPAPKIPLKISKFSEISRLGDRLKLNSIVVERAYSLAEVTNFIFNLNLFRKPTL